MEEAREETEKRGERKSRREFILAAMMVAVSGVCHKRAAAFFAYRKYLFSREMKHLKITEMLLRVTVSRINWSRANGRALKNIDRN